MKSTEPDREPTMSDFATSADGTRIAYDRYGSGPTVILVGGKTESPETAAGNAA
jgi:hypothetical protein